MKYSCKQPSLLSYHPYETQFTWGSRGEGRGGGGGGTRIWKKLGCSSYVIGFKICRLALLLVLKSKMTMVGIIAVPFRD